MIYKLVGIRGPLALFLKLGLLGGADAFLIWLTAAALNKNSFIIAGVVIATIIFLNYSFITKGAIPLKFLAVGLVFFSIFVITPTGYTIVMSTYNFKTGNEIAKSAAIQEIINNLTSPRMAKGEDIINVIDFFASEKSSYITAQTIYLGGIN